MSSLSSDFSKTLTKFTLLAGGCAFGIALLLNPLLILPLIALSGLVALGAIALSNNTKPSYTQKIQFSPA